MADPFNLERFVDAQAGVHEDVLAEMRSGAKKTHWMWYVFPQLRGLGRSVMAERYGISDLREARAYLDHPVLGARLRQLVDILLSIEGRSAHAIFSTPDDLKFHSSMTLFRAAAPDDPRFQAALAKYFSGEPDAATEARLS